MVPPEKPAAERRSLHAVDLISRELNDVVVLPNFSPIPLVEWPKIQFNIEVDKSDFTKTEIDCLEHLSNGVLIGKMGNELRISSLSVQQTIRSLKDKLGVLNTVEPPAVVRAGIECGIVIVEPQELAPEQKLTDSEFEVLEYISRGMTRPEIAAERGESKGKVDKLHNAIVGKLGAKNLSHAVKKAYEFGVFKKNDSNLLVAYEARVSPLNTKQAFLVDAISRGESPRNIALQSGIRYEYLPVAYQYILHALGVTSLTQAVNISVPRGFIPVRRDTGSSPEPNYNDSETTLLHGIRRGLSNLAIIHSLGVDPKGFVRVRESAYEKIGAVSNPNAARRLYELKKAA